MGTTPKERNTIAMERRGDAGEPRGAKKHKVRTHRDAVDAVAVANTMAEWLANDHKVAGNAVDAVGNAVEAQEDTRERRIEVVTVWGRGLLGCYQRVHAVYV